MVVCHAIYQSVINEIRKITVVFLLGATGVPSGVLVRVRRTLGKGSYEGAMVGGGYWRRWPYARSV